MVNSSGLENRYSSKQRTIEGSNPSLSFCSMNRFFYLLLFPGFLIKFLIKLRILILIINKKGMARLGGIAEPEKKV